LFRLSAKMYNSEKVLSVSAHKNARNLLSLGNFFGIHMYRIIH
jgi:hypothetical protein